MSSKNPLVLRLKFREQKCYRDDECQGNIELELVNNSGPQELRYIYEAVAHLNHIVKQKVPGEKMIEADVAVRTDQLRGLEDINVEKARAKIQENIEILQALGVDTIVLQSGLDNPEKQP